MGRKRDEFWQYVDTSNGNKCNFCGHGIPGASRIKFHLAQIPGEGIRICDKVPDDVKSAAALALNSSNKRVKQSRTPTNLEENNTASSLSRGSTRGEIEVDLLPTTDLVGRRFQRYLDKIWEWLMKDEVSIMGVCGMGGVGKTALLKHVYNKLLNDKHHVIWITISRNYSIRQLQRDIAKDIGIDISDENDELKIAARLLRAFKKITKCVVILDDVWYDISLEDVGIPLIDSGIKIIVGSRLLDVCKRIGCKQNIVNLECLYEYEDEDFTLFSKSLGDDVTLLARNLTRECGGLPLAIVTIARSMRGKAEIREWRDALSKLRSPEKDHNDVKRSVFPVLKYSFDHLNDRTVQDCFLYLPLYFKGGKDDYDGVCREDLIRIFVDEGLIDGGKDFEAQLDEGHLILNKLINNNLLVEDIEYIDGSALRLHEMVRAMAVNIGKESHGYMCKTELPDEREWEEDLQKISIIGDEITRVGYEVTEIPLGMSPKCPRLSTLRMRGARLEVIPDNFFINMPSLKILDLSDNDSIEVLPASISNLECLTVLLLGWCESLRHIPSLAKLRQLRRLDLVKTAITQVPLGFENLTNLRWLRLEGTAVMKAQYLERLPMLESIGATFVDKDEFNACVQIVRARINSGLMRGYFLRLVVDAINLGKCGISHNIDSDKTIDIEGVHCCNNSLSIKDCNQWRSLREVLSIQEIIAILSMLSKENEVASSFLPFSHLTKLSIERCDGMKKLLTLGTLTQLHNLEEIRVEYCQSMEEIFSTVSNEELCLPFGIEPYEDEAINLPKLKSVSLRYLPQLSSICRGIIVCDSLEKFSIAACPKLRCVRIPTDIDVLEIEDCNQWKSLCDGLSIQQNKNKLHISKCNVDWCNELEYLFCLSGGCTLCSSLQGLSELNLKFLSSLSMLWKENEVASSFLPFSHLTKLSIWECKGMKKLLTPGMSTQLHNLEEIEVENCYSMEEIFSRAKSNIGDEYWWSFMDDSNVEAINLPNLKSVSLKCLPQLKSVCKGIIVCGSLKEFNIVYCPKLKCVPQTQPPFEIQVKAW